VSLSCATVIDWAMGPYAGKQTGEAALLWTLLENFKPGDMMIADRLYTSYFMIARLKQLGVDVVMRQHQTRHTDFRRGRRLGTRDHVVQWDRPVRPTWMDEATYAGMPASLTMREVRAGGWTLVTSLVDAKSVSKMELVELYHSRWHVELDFRSIKDVMQMDELRCKTAQMVRKEVAVHLLAYNLIRTVTAHAADLARVLPRRMSFKATLQTLTVVVQVISPRVCHADLCGWGDGLPHWVTAVEWVARWRKAAEQRQRPGDTGPLRFGGLTWCAGRAGVLIRRDRQTALPAEGFGAGAGGAGCCASGGSDRRSGAGRCPRAARGC
jgi:hypothetical protein